MLILELDEDTLVFFLNNKYPFIVYNVLSNIPYVISGAKLGTSPEQLMAEGGKIIEYENLPQKVKTTIQASMSILLEAFIVQRLKKA